MSSLGRLTTLLLVSRLTVLRECYGGLEDGGFVVDAFAGRGGIAVGGKDVFERIHVIFHVRCDYEHALAMRGAFGKKIFLDVLCTIGGRFPRAMHHRSLWHGTWKVPPR
jgi:hypothetical protein